MILISGFICETIDFQTTSDENWLWGSTITHSKKILQSENHDCVLALERHLSGDMSVPYYPDPECYYARIYTSQNKLIQITEMKLPYDPYKGVILSNHLMHTECSHVLCMMMDSKSIWIMDHANEGFCKEEQPSNEIEVWAQGYGDFKAGEDIELWSFDAILGKRKTACRMQFCNILGMRFPSGDWIGLPKSMKDSNKVALTADLKPCNSTTKVNNRDVKALVDQSLLVLDGEERRGSCVQAKIRLIDSGKFSRADLQNFIPKTPGNHPVYMIDNNTLMDRIGHYKLIFFLPSSDDFWNYVLKSSFSYLSNPKIKSCV